MFHNFPAAPERYQFWDDFSDEYTLTASASPWVGTALASGTASWPDVACGVIRLNGAATTDNSGYQIQRDTESFALIEGCTSRLMAGFRLSDATESHFFVGASITDTTICDGADGFAGLTSSDCIGLYKPDGSKVFYLVVKRDSTYVVQQALFTAEDTVGYHIAISVQMTGPGVGTIMAWAYDESKVEVGRTGPVGGVTLPYNDEEQLAEAVALVSGNATGTKSADVDYIGSEVTR